MTDKDTADTANESSLFNLYARQVAQIERQHHDTQQQLWHDAHVNTFLPPDVKARARRSLWSQATKIVLFTLAKMKRSGRLPTVGYDDLDAIQEANLVVGEMLPKWDPDRGTLATYLVPSIRGTLLNYANTHLNGGIGSKHVSVIRVGMDEQVDSEEISAAQDEPGVEQTVGITREESLTYDDDTPMDRLMEKRELLNMLMFYSEASVEHYVEGFSAEEIASRHSVSAETVRRTLRDTETSIKREYAKK